MNINLREELTPAVAAAIDQYCQGEDVRWDLTFTAFPNPTQPGAMIAVVLLYTQINGAVLGTHLTMTSLMSPNISVEQVDGDVHKIIDSMFEQRLDQLGSMNEQQEDAYANGEPPPAGGLILPRPQV